MPYLLMAVFGIIFIASYLLPVKWILEDQRACNNEKAVFILLTVLFWIFSYYFFHAYIRYFKKK